MNQSHPNTLRHLSNTFRHPQIYQCWRCEGHCQEFPIAQTQLGKAVVGYNLFSYCYSINTVLATSRINQTPSRNPPDTPKHNAITSVLILSVASTRLFGTQSNLFGCFLSSLVYVLDSRHQGDWIVSGGCLEGFWMLSDWSWILPRLY